MLQEKASNAGGVAASGLRNELRIHCAYSWSREEVDQRLQSYYGRIFMTLAYNMEKDEHGSVDYVKGANIAGFVKVANAMLAQGVV